MGSEEIEIDKMTIVRSEHRPLHRACTNVVVQGPFQLVVLRGGVLFSMWKMVLSQCALWTLDVGGVLPLLQAE